MGHSIEVKPSTLLKGIVKPFHMAPLHDLEDMVETKFQADAISIQPVSHLINFRGEVTRSRDQSVRSSQKERQRFFDSEDRKKEDEVDQFVRTLVEEEKKVTLDWLVKT